MNALHIRAHSTFIVPSRRASLPLARQTLRHSTVTTAATEVGSNGRLHAAADGLVLEEFIHRSVPRSSHCWDIAGAMRRHHPQETASRDGQAGVSLWQHALLMPWHQHSDLAQHSR